MNFFVYQVLADNESACVAPEAHSLQGVVWHLHNEVVTQSCPRRMHRSRVVRCRAAVFNTEQPFLEWKGQFGPYTNFNEGLGGMCAPLLLAAELPGRQMCQPWL